MAVILVRLHKGYNARAAISEMCLVSAMNLQGWIEDRDGFPTIAIVTDGEKMKTLALTLEGMTQVECYTIEDENGEYLPSPHFGEPGTKSRISLPKKRKSWLDSSPTRTGYVIFLVGCAFGGWLLAKLVFMLARAVQ